MPSPSSIVIVILLIATFIYGAWAGLFGVHARSQARQLLRSRQARRQEREMRKVMQAKIAAIESKNKR